MGLSRRDELLLEVLVAMAWADGEITEPERQLLRGILHALGAGSEHAEALARRLAVSAPTDLESLDVTGLSARERGELYRAAAMLALADGLRHGDEDDLLDRLADRLGLDPGTRPVEEATAAAMVRRLFGLPDGDPRVADKPLGRHRREVQVFRDRAEISATRLHGELAELCAPSYEDTVEILTRSLARCDTLYTTRDDRGSLSAFFMTSWAPLVVEGQERAAAYLGLSATSAATKSSGLVRRLYAEFLHDARAWELTSGRHLILWATTATPSAYFAVQTLFADVQPRADGTVTDDGRQIAAILRGRLGAQPPEPDDHPFLLRGVAGTTRYSAAERERIRAIAERKGFRLLSDVGVDERRGDRVLLLCAVPPVLIH